MVEKQKALRLAGIVWEGTWQEIEDLKSIINAMKENLMHYRDRCDTTCLYGISIFSRPDGFSYFCGFSLKLGQEVPEGLVEYKMKEMILVTRYCRNDDDIGLAYQIIEQTIKSKNFELHKEKEVVYYDSLPIKYERYGFAECEGYFISVPIKEKTVPL